MSRAHRAVLLLAVTALLGCGGDDPPAPVAPVPANNPPVITAIANQTTDVDVPLDVGVTIADEEVISVTLNAASSSPALIDSSGFAFSGSGGMRTLTLTPKAGQSGSATITVTATDAASKTGVATFDLTVGVTPPGGTFTWSELLLASDGDLNSNFGASVCADGDLIVVGTRDDSGAGHAYVFRNNLGTITETWSVTELGSFFGTITALDGDFLASGKAGDTYMYSRDTPAADSWTSEGTLSTSGFMALSGNRLFIVDPLQVARVFTRTGSSWIHTGSPNPGILDAADVFGSSVAMDGDVAVVGATGDDDADTDAGAAYVFRYAGAWTMEQKLTAGDGGGGDGFGRSVAVEGDLIVVGAPYEDEHGSSAGAAYVFTRSGSSWTQAAKLWMGDAGDLFGISVDIDAGEILVGASSANSNGTSGLGYHFTGSGATWAGVVLKGLGSKQFDSVGSSVAISGDVVILGAPGDDDQGSNSGSAHLFVR